MRMLGGRCRVLAELLDFGHCEGSLTRDRDNCPSALAKI